MIYLQDGRGASEHMMSMLLVRLVLVQVVLLMPI